jgi:L-ascorbate metabolism protein UlaG (beta-lactamase superfamily)
MRSKQFGGKLTKICADEYQKSENWKNGKFQNIEPTSLNISLNKIPGLLYKQFKNKAAREPISPIPIASFNKSDFLETSDRAKFIWYGHSVVLMRINNQTLLIDPMLGPDSSPIAPITTKRYSKNTLNLIDDFPEIDLLLLTHDHYDHLDLASIEKLKHKTKKYFVALGVKRHLVKWGISAEFITEFDWWDNQIFENIDITFTPTRHFSGRGLTDRAKSLWGGWAFKTSTENILFSGDSGYGKHFAELGKKLGAFDFAFMECGQYNENWHQIHMYPEESIQAAIDLNVKKVMPVHWAGFSLSLHSWSDPVERFTLEAEKQKMELMLPTLGQLFAVSDTIITKWWEDKEL